MIDLKDGGYDKSVWLGQFNAAQCASWARYDIKTPSSIDIQDGEI